MTHITPGVYQGLRRLSDASGHFKMLAVDQRPPIETLVSSARDVSEASVEDVTNVKTALIDHLCNEATAVLVDPQYLFPAVLERIPAGKGLLVTLEYDKFVETEAGRESAQIPDWSVSQIKLSGGDAVKLLAWYRPDAGPEILEHQQEFVEAVGAECRRHDIPFVFELLVYPFPGERGHTVDYVESPGKRAEHVIESVETFAHPKYQVDVFKLESPISADLIASAEDTAEHGRVFADLDKAAGRPWVILSAGADQATFRIIAELAFRAGASGYLAGRAIWWEACVSTFPDLDAMSVRLEASSVPYMSVLNELTDRFARPWWQHPKWGPSGPTLDAPGQAFRQAYKPLAP